MSLLRPLLAAATRRLPEQHRGQGRLMQALDERVSKEPPLVEAPMRLGYRMQVDLRSRTEVFSYFTGRYDTALIAAAVRLMPAGGVAFDVGANVGFWSVPLAKRGSVHAYEPVPANAERVKTNAALNAVSDKLEVHQVALSDTPGRLRLTLREDFQRGASTGNAAVVIDSDDDRFRAIDVEVTTMDSEVERLLLQRLDVLKIDIEGHEDFALVGGRAGLRRFQPVIFVEWNADYYRRRGADARSLFAGALEDLGYAYLRHDASGWTEVDSFSSPRPIDDLVLCPARRVAEVLGVLGD